MPAGQLDFCGYTANRGLVEPNASTFFRPTHAIQYGSELFVVDGGNNRLLVFNAAGFGSSSTAKMSARTTGGVTIQRKLLDPA